MFQFIKQVDDWLRFQSGREDINDNEHVGQKIAPGEDKSEDNAHLFLWLRVYKEFTLKRYSTLEFWSV